MRLQGTELKSKKSSIRAANVRSTRSFGAFDQFARYRRKRINVPINVCSVGKMVVASSWFMPHPSSFCPCNSLVKHVWSSVLAYRVDDTFDSTSEVLPDSVYRSRYVTSFHVSGCTCSKSFKPEARGDGESICPVLMRSIYPR